MLFVYTFSVFYFRNCNERVRLTRNMAPLNEVLLLTAWFTWIHIFNNINLCGWQALHRPAIIVFKYTILDCWYLSYCGRMDVSHKYFSFMTLCETLVAKNGLRYVAVDSFLHPSTGGLLYSEIWSTTSSTGQPKVEDYNLRRPIIKPK